MNPLQKSRKVLLINSYSDEYSEVLKKTKNPFQEGHLFVETPLGIAYVYSYAKENLPDIDFAVIDAQAMLIENVARGMDYNWQLLMKKVKEINPDVVGIGAYYNQSSRLFHETCRRIKEILHNVVIVGGGNYPTDTAETTLQDSNVDYVIVSEGERAFAEFIRAYYDGKDVTKIDNLGFRDPEGNTHVNKVSLIADVSSIPIPDRSPLPMHIYGNGRNMLDRIFGSDEYRALTMTISRGCPHGCTFCTAKNFWGRTIRYRDTESVLDEMQMLKEEYGANVIVINDDNYLFNKKKSSEIMRGMIKRKLNIKWFAGGGTAVRAFNDDNFLDLAVESGYSLFNLAIESSSDETLKRIKKPVRVKETVSLVEKIRKRYPHMWISGYFVVGFPFESKQDIVNTLQFSQELELDWCFHSIYTLLPGTDLHREFIGQVQTVPDNVINTEGNSDIIYLNGPDWDRSWLFGKQIEYNSKVNFINNRNIKCGNYDQALRDFEYIINIAPGHALAYRQAALVSEMLGDYEKAVKYAKQEITILKEENDFEMWYRKLSIVPISEGSE